MSAIVRDRNRPKGQLLADFAEALIIVELTELQPCHGVTF